MNIIISNADPRPIYEQIYAQIKACILSGELAEGDLLPSIRSLAKDLRISVITTKRAYEELEKSGYIHTVAGKGCYVAPKNVQLVREEHLTRVEEHLRQAVGLARACGLSPEETGEMLRLLFEEE
ncbi:MAG: GntR family transcriptional regulator [Oscillospiraceae bacterium]